MTCHLYNSICCAMLDAFLPQFSMLLLDMERNMTNQKLNFTCKLCMWHVFDLKNNIQTTTTEKQQQVKLPFKPPNTSRLSKTQVHKCFGCYCSIINNNDIWWKERKKNAKHPRIGLVVSVECKELTWNSEMANTFAFILMKLKHIFFAFLHLKTFFCDLRLQIFILEELLPICIINP